MGDLILPILISSITSGLLLYLACKIWRIKNAGLIPCLTTAFLWLALEFGLKYLLFVADVKAFPMIIVSLIGSLFAAFFIKGFSNAKLGRSWAATLSVFLIYWGILFLFFAFSDLDIESRDAIWRFFLGLPADK